MKEYGKSILGGKWENNKFVRRINGKIKNLYEEQENGGNR